MEYFETDEDGNGILDYAELAEQKGVQIVTLAFGDKNLGKITAAQKTLKDISKLTGGQYYYCSIVPNGDEFAKQTLQEQVNEIKSSTKKAISDKTPDGVVGECGFSDSQLNQIFDEDARFDDGTLIKIALRDDNGDYVTKDVFKNGGSDYDDDGIDNNKELVRKRSNGNYVWKFVSSPTKKDTDRDGALDNEDKYPRKFNEKIAYMFYPEDGESFLKDEAEAREKAIKINYTMYHCNVKAIPVKDLDDFQDKWNNMDLDEDGKKEYIIDQVHLIFHGSPKTIMITPGKDICTDDYNNKSYLHISELATKKINYLNLSSCNGGNLDYNSDYKMKKYTDNIARAFLKSKHEINMVTGWDGYSTFSSKEIKDHQGNVVYIQMSEKSKSESSTSTTDNFQAWSIDVNGKKREAEQQITYWKDDNGKIKYYPYKKHFIS